MARSHRPVELTPEELKFDLADWAAEEMAIIDQHGSEWECVCPACGAEKLALNVQRKAWQCWSCPFAGWQPHKLVAKQMECSYERALQIINTSAMGLRDWTRPVKALAQGDNTGALQTLLPTAPPPPGLSPLDGPTAAYAHSRGIPSEHAYWTGLQAVHGDGSGSLVEWMTRGRLLIPVWDMHGRFVHWVARATDNHDIKTVNLPEACNGVTWVSKDGTKRGPECRQTPDCTCKHERWGLSPTPKAAGSGEVLAGLHLLKRGEPCYLVEGPIDYAVCGPGFVSALGAKLSIFQAMLLVQAGVSEVVILFDGDEPGRIGAEKAFRLLSPLVKTRIGECPVRTDPGVLGRARCLDIAARAWSTEIIVSLDVRAKPRPSPFVGRNRSPFVEKL